MRDQLHSWVEALNHNIPLAAKKAEIVNDFPDDKLNKLNPEFIAYYIACEASRVAGEPYMDANKTGSELTSRESTLDRQELDELEDTLVERYRLAPDFLAALKKCIAAEDAALKAAGLNPEDTGTAVDPAPVPAQAPAPAVTPPPVLPKAPDMNETIQQMLEDRTYP